MKVDPFQQLGINTKDKFGNFIPKHKIKKQILEILITKQCSLSKEQLNLLTQEFQRL